MKRFNIMQRAKMIMSLKRNFGKYLERFEESDTCREEAYKKKTIRKILSGKFLFVEHFELIVTTKCSLNCRGCSNGMPFYRAAGTAYFREKEEVFKEIDELVDSIDEILNCRILGGEPLLHPDIAEIIEYLLHKKNIGTLHIITNGTIIPNEKTIKIMHNNRVIVIFSDYGNASKQMKNCVAALAENNVRYSINNMLKWSDLGKFEKRDATKKELILQRKRCQFCCRTYLNGKFYLCPRSAFGTDLKYFDYPGDYVDIVSIESSDVKRKKIATLLYSKKYIEGCAYCLAATPQATMILPGQQI